MAIGVASSQWKTNNHVKRIRQSGPDTQIFFRGGIRVEEIVSHLDLSCSFPDPD